MFRLSRYYSTASLFGIAVAVVVLYFFFRHLAFGVLVQHAQRENVDLTRAFANTVWVEYADFVRAASALPLEELPKRGEVARLRDDVLTKMRGLSVVKVKIYNLDGLTVFSTDPKQIGESKASNSGFTTARQGGVATEITFRDHFDAFEQVIFDRNLVSSYVPIVGDQGRVQGVFEVYSDVTDLVTALDKVELRIVAVVLGAFTSLYLFLFVIVRRADLIIRAQHAAQLATEERIRFQAYHDALTGLPNRTAFSERLDETIRLARRTGRNFGLMFLDLDRFKLVNDSLGHDAGDELLQVVSKRIQWCVRESDMLFRMGGDEFTVILETLDRPEDAAFVSARIIDVMAEPLRLQGHEINVGVSIGITIFPNDADRAEDLIKNADTAMYLAKDSGRGRYEFYTASMNRQAMERLTLDASLQRAVKRGEFVLHYQPRLSAETGRIVAAEALLRWQHPEMGLLMPERFMNLLEESGQIVQVGNWVLREACVQARRWMDAGLNIRVSVNLCARELREPALVAMVRQVLEETGLKPGLLELEFTESVLLGNAERVENTLGAIKALGVALSVDNFGSSHSAFQFLKRFEVDFLKISPLLTREVENDPRDAAIVRAIAGLTHSFDVALVAEGVERSGQADFMRANRCQEMQGYFLGQPVSGEKLTELLGTPADYLSSRA